jgi:predicted  nucleic acid-binding Zn-ribbon protein
LDSFSTTKENEDLKKKLKDLEVSFVKKEKDYSKLEEKVCKSKSALEEKSKLLDDMQKENSSLFGEKSKLKSEIYSLNYQLDKANKTVSSLRDEVEKEKKEIQRMEPIYSKNVILNLSSTVFSQITLLNDSLLKENEQTKKDMKDLRYDTNNKVSSLEYKVTTLTREKENEARELKKSREKVVNLESEINQCKRDLDDKEGEIRSLKIEMKKEGKDFEEKEKILKMEIKGLEIEVKDLRDRNLAITDKKIKEDPRTDTTSVEIQQKYNKITDTVFYEIIELFYEEEDELEERQFYQFLLSILVRENPKYLKEFEIEISEKNKEILTTKMTEKFLELFSLKNFNCKQPKHIKDLEDQISPCVEFSILLANLDSPFIFMGTEKMNYDTSKVDLDSQHIKIVELIRPGITYNGYPVAKAKVKVELRSSSK